MGQSQAYKRRHPGRRGQISAQEYTGLTFRWIAGASAEGEDSRGQAAGNKASQDRPGHTTARARTDSTGTVRQGRPGGRTQGQEGSRETQQARHTHHAQQAATRHAGQARQQRDEAGQGPSSREHRCRGPPS